MNIEKSMEEAAHTIVTSVTCVKKNFNVLVVCGVHNKVFAEYVMQESYAVGAYPHLWVFDDSLFRKYSEMFVTEAISVLPEHSRSLLEKSDVVIWLSQFDDIEKLSANVRKAIVSFWDNVYEMIKGKPCLFVTLLSSECIEGMGINYNEFLRTFVEAVNVDYSKLQEIGRAVASWFIGKKLVRVYDANGTDLTFSIDKRHVGVEGGTLENCFSVGRECEVEVPAGEVYVAPIETSANGELVVEEFRDYGIKNLELRFKGGRIVNFKAEKGNNAFRALLKEAEGDKDRIAELGIGINYGIKPIGYRLYDEKALGTAHIAIGNNVHLGGVNKASIHYDFVLYNPNIEADNTLLMKKGKLV